MPAAASATRSALVDRLGRRIHHARRRLGLVQGREQLVALPGIGPWTAEMIAMRALGDPDAFPSTDMGVVKAARGLGIDGDLAAHAHAWRPWRSYAVQYLWSYDEKDDTMKRHETKVTRARTIDSPIGPITLAGDDDVLTQLVMHEQRHAPVCSMAAYPQDTNAFGDVVDQLTGVLRRRAHRLRRRHAARRNRVSAEGVAGTAGRFPTAKTWSYGQLAEHIGAHNAQRAVGLANGKNPVAIIVPCHRVIGASGNLVGYGGGLSRKVFLLALEGLQFSGMNVVQEACTWVVTG